MSDLQLIAGASALRHIRAHGLRADDISWLAGASGGPKWFVLYGMDKYLAGEFFSAKLQTRQQPLRMIGSSAGAWRLACYAHSDPVSALQRLAFRYAGQVYSDAPDKHEISREARAMLDWMLGDSGASDIALNTQRRLYVIADSARRLVSSDKKLPLNAGLLMAALSNMVSRKLLRQFFERHVFYNSLDRPDSAWLTDMPTSWLPLRPDNVREVLMATGSIPQIMESVHGIAGSEDIVYRDGGITDYHLDLPFNTRPGLVLYPHFYAGIVPGWFDKFAGWRRAHPAYFDNVVLVSPSRTFVESLPFGKIPDRNDFRRMTQSRRVEYWKHVLAESERLATELRDLVNHGKGIEKVMPFTARRGGHI
ncbi:MAG: patatin-like phospholipase family protein [Pseudohongiella sp.]|nr:patatin-like phospholipase family protein [Pseudohongiella sp.]